LANVTDQARLFTVACIRLVGSFFLCLDQKTLSKVIDAYFSEVQEPVGILYPDVVCVLLGVCKSRKTGCFFVAEKLLWKLLLGQFIL